MENTDNLSKVESDISQELSLEQQAESEKEISVDGSIEELIESERTSEDQPGQVTSQAKIVDGSEHTGELRNPSTI